MDIVINLDKPKGITSHHAVMRVKKILGAKKAGHAGTLDPLATGVLLVCINEATKITRFLSDLDKEYTALMKFGEKTDTLDAGGKIIQKAGDFSFGIEKIQEALEGFKGVIRQTPPMYSAVKIRGTPLYKLARKGIEIERSERAVTIKDIEITGFNLPYLWIKVLCSRGTYIRTLCDDIGETLGVGAYLAELKRTCIGDFRISDSIALDELEKVVRGSESGVQCDNPAIVSIDNAVKHLAELFLTEDEFIAAKNGLTFRCAEPFHPSDEYIRLKDPSGRLFAIGGVKNGLVKIERMLHSTA